MNTLLSQHTIITNATANNRMFSEKRVFKNGMLNIGIVAHICIMQMTRSAVGLGLE